MAEGPQRQVLHEAAPREIAYRAAAHGHSEEDLLAVGQGAAVHRDVVDVFSGCRSAQARGLEDSAQRESL